MKRLCRNTKLMLSAYVRAQLCCLGSDFSKEHKRGEIFLAKKAEIPMDRCIRMAESLCCPSETITAL